MIIPFNFSGPTTSTGNHSLYVADTAAELLASTANAGEMGFAKDTGIFYVRSNVATWLAQGAGPGSSVYAEQTEIDFGATPVAEASFTITDAGVTSASIITGSVAYLAPTGKDLDEIDMDELSLSFGAGSGSFTIFARGLSGYIADKFIINYHVG